MKFVILIILNIFLFSCGNNTKHPHAIKQETYFDTVVDNTKGDTEVKENIVVPADKTKVVDSTDSNYYYNNGNL